MNYEIIFNEIKNNDIQIAEIYDSRNNNLDFVVMFLNINLNIITEVENRITEYRKNGGTCIIGCINPDSAFKKMNSLFDFYLYAAGDSDFKNLIDFCVSTEDSEVHISYHDFKSQPGTEVFVVTEQDQSFEQLIKNLRKSCQKKLENHSVKKFQKIFISLMTNGRSLLLSEAKEIKDFLDDYLTDNSQCMWNSCVCMKDLTENEVKVTVIYLS